MGAMAQIIQMDDVPENQKVSKVSTEGRWEIDDMQFQNF